MTVEPTTSALTDTDKFELAATEPAAIEPAPAEPVPIDVVTGSTAAGSVHPEPNESEADSAGAELTQLLAPDPELVAALHPYLAALRRDLPEADAARLAAYICWSGICEPGDAAAGALVAQFGPETVYALFAGKEEQLYRLIEQHHLDEYQAWGAAFARWRPRLRHERMVSACHNAAQLGVRLLVPDDPQWPAGLDALGESSPHVLWVRGDLEALRGCAKSVALVGARAASTYGTTTTADLAAGLSDRGFTIVSGGAYGIDAAAHRTALASEAPTVAVLAGGVDRLYPAANRGLFEQIIARGALVSELVVGQAPERWRFIQRNRIIAALTQVTVVVEAGARSGALHTANGALQIGRKVGAVPGLVHSAASVGCHRLIQDELARLVTDSDDIVQLWRESEGIDFAAPQLDLEIPDALRPDRAGGDKLRQLSVGARRMHDALRVRGARLPEELAEHAGMSMVEVRAALTELELHGFAVADAGGWRRGA
ncbi:DNA-processing protein DprA [Gulosibacter sp. GYB002]|uniref:DNA-processing protein DprA n=1 Tax=Gulosibacter sp. GYB002 TaxID=2994391 RepID=UPI002F960E8E